MADADVRACRTFAGELAIVEMTQRTYSELQQYLDVGTRALLDALSNAGPNDRSLRQSQVDAAVRVCGKVFGQHYAALLDRAAEVAAGPERKAAQSRSTRLAKSICAFDYSRGRGPAALISH